MKICSDALTFFHCSGNDHFEYIRYDHIHLQVLSNNKVGRMNTDHVILFYFYLIAFTAI